ncbi:MAG TPA: hypothetical protein VHW70_15580, partial [Edaphobacter sp.]|nr:hypothetical protein [Edaphobacter sp.]
PQRLKSQCDVRSYGATEVAPFQNNDFFRSLGSGALKRAGSVRNRTLPVRAKNGVPSHLFFCCQLGFD